MGQAWRKPWQWDWEDWEEWEEWEHSRQRQDWQPTWEWQQWEDEWQQWQEDWQQWDFWQEQEWGELVEASTLG